jgi:hypothetical protein
MARKQVLLVNIIIRVRVDKDVGEWGCCVPNVATAPEQPEKVADLSVDPRNFFLAIFDVDGSVVSLVINQSMG